MALQGNSLRVWQTLLVVLPSFLLFGYNQVGVGGLLSFDNWTRTFPEIDISHTAGDTRRKSIIQGVYVSTIAIGAFIGAMVCSSIGDIIGRRKTIFIGALLNFIGAIISCTSFQLAQLITSRLILGIGVGLLSAIVPVWQSECSQAINRGRNVVVVGISITAGYASTSWVNIGFSYMDESSVSWRVPLAIPCILALILTVSIFFFPESPRWLLRVGDKNRAAAELARLNGCTVDDPRITEEISGIESSLEISSQKAASIRDIFTMKNGKLFYRFALCLGLQFFLQMTGGNVISTYITTIFEDNLAMSPRLARVLALAVLTWKFLASFIAFFTIDRFGRRKLFLFTGCGLTLSMLCMSVATSFPHDNNIAPVFSAISIFMFCFFYPIGFMGPSFLYATEVAPIRLRVAMASISTANNWLWNIVVQLVTPTALATIGYQYWVVYAVLCATFVILVFFLYPETMGQSLERLEDIFQQDISILNVVKVANSMSKGSTLDGDASHSERVTVSFEHKGQQA